jgi:chemotaxis protein CheX
MNVQEQDIRDITGAVWTSVLRRDAETPSGDPEAEFAGSVMTGCVQMSGTWDGAVTLQCSIQLARAAAAAMYDSDPTEMSSAEIRDALGELTNMVGGNIKALLPGPTQLSLPFVVEGGKYSLNICNVVAVHRVWFSSLGETFVVTLLARDNAQDPVSAAPMPILTGGFPREDSHR